jgi:UDP:flavonoid glycosyltransferase YjiC (YdhE family)
VRWIEALPNYELMDLLDGAAVAVTTGGSLLLQSLALGTPTVALPASRDQPGRIARCVAGGLALTCAPEADAVARCVSALAADQGRLLQLRSALAASEMAGGLERAMGAIESLLAS